MTWQNARSRAAGARTAPPQSISLGPSAVMITLPGWRSVWHSPSPGRRRSIRARMPVAMCSGSCAAGAPQRAVHQVAKKQDVRRRGRVVNGQAKRRDDRARLRIGDGAAARELQQGRSVEARQHDAEAPLQGHLAEHLGRRAARGENGAGHPRLPPADPLRHAGLEQLHDLTGRPGVDVREGAFAVFSRQASHAPSPARPRHATRLAPGASSPHPAPPDQRPGVARHLLPGRRDGAVAPR